MQTGTSEISKSQTPQKTLGFLNRQLLFNSSNNIFKAHFSSPPLSSGLFIMIFVNFYYPKKINCPLNVLGQERSVSICFNRIFLSMGLWGIIQFHKHVRGSFQPSSEQWRRRDLFRRATGRGKKVTGLKLQQLHRMHASNKANDDDNVTMRSTNVKVESSTKKLLDSDTTQFQIGRIDFTLIH